MNSVKKFLSIEDLTAFIAGTKPNGFFARKKRLASIDGTARFTGTEDFAEATGLLSLGWKDGADRVKSIMVQAPAVASDRPRKFYSVVGFAPCVGRCLIGHPKSMINKKRVRVPSRVVDIVYNCAADCSITTNQMETAAAKLFNVIAGLEHSGMQVNLWTTNMITDGRDCCTTFLKIKEAGQPFNLLKMVYPIVHPSFLRRHIFAVIERSNLNASGKWEYYGRPIKDDAKSKALTAAAGVKSDNIFDYYKIHDLTEKEICDLIQ